MEVLHIHTVAAAVAVHSKHCAAVFREPYALHLITIVHIVGVPTGDGSSRVERKDVLRR